MRIALFWAFAQQVVPITYRRFGTTYQSHLQVTLEDGTDRLSRNVGIELTLLTA